MKTRLFLPWSLIIGSFFLTSQTEAARATTLILGKSKTEPKIDIIPTAEEENGSISAVNASSNLSNETITVGNVTKLTGVPQIDYIYDPNLPRELNGYNLTDYPFYNSVPEDIDFKCDGLHDGFYASVPHKCQVYHHCLFGTRYDFLCANYTAFDQKTFICHFASEVDCKNSPRYFVRNEALYKATTTTTVSPFGSSGLAGRRSQLDGGRRRRPFRKRKPSYEYYDEYEDVEDDYYDEASSSNKKKKRPRPQGGRDNYEDPSEEETGLPPTGPNKSVFDRPRVAPKIRRPVPVNEREKYDYNSDSRVIVKEPAVEKKNFEDAEGNKNPVNNKFNDYYKSTGNLKSKEQDTERERERIHRGESDYDSERDRELGRERERERERDRDRDREERPFRDRRPPKKRRRPDDLDDYEDYESVRRYRPSSRNSRPRYEEYEDYEYDDKPYRRNREQDYRNRDYDREKPYRNRDSDYERPRNRDRIREDERLVRDRDVEEKAPRSRVEDRNVRKDEERLFRNREPVKGLEDRPNRNKNEQYRIEGKNRNREDSNGEDRQYYYNTKDERFRGKEEESSKIAEELYEEEPITLKKTEKGDKNYKYIETENIYRQEEVDKYNRGQDRSKTYDRPSRLKDSLDRFGKNRSPSRDSDIEDEPKNIETYSNGRARPVEPLEQTSYLRNDDKEISKPSFTQRTKLLKISADKEAPDNSNQPVPASRPAYITKPLDTTLPFQNEQLPQLQQSNLPRKSFSEQNERKSPGSFKRPFQPKFPSPQEEEEQLNSKITKSKTFENAERYKTEEAEVEKYYPDQPLPPRFSSNLKSPTENSEKKYALHELFQTEEKPSSSLQKLKVPPEESEENFAPKAPKFPQTASRRRPFLPSRNGNPTLPRGLQPVGTKAIQPPRGFQTQNKKPEDSKLDFQNNNPEIEKQQNKSPIPGGKVEFRAKLSTAIGVDQPKLTQFFDEAQSSDLELPEYEENPLDQTGIDVDYSNLHQIQGENQEVKSHSSSPILAPSTLPQSSPKSAIVNQGSSDFVVSNYRPEGQSFPQHSNLNINFRPMLKSTDFSQEGETISSTQQQAQEGRNEQVFVNKAQLPFVNHQSQSNQFTPKNPIFFPPSAPAPVSPSLSNPLSQHHLSPPSFYSENPKFKTTIKVPDQSPLRTVSQNVNYNTGSHLPIFNAPFRPGTINEQRQIDQPQENIKPINLKFPNQHENLDESNEDDVSLNDALQPISSLHPRNVLTGVYLSQTQRSQPTLGFKRRSHQNVALNRQGSENQELPNNRKSEFPSRIPQEPKNVPVQQKRFVMQRQSSSSLHPKFIQPPVFQPIRSVNVPAGYLTILTH